MKTKLRNQLKSMRVVEGWSLQQVADAAGVSKTAIWDLEQGHCIPTLLTAMQIADVFECSIYEIWFRYEESVMSTEKEENVLASEAVYVFAAWITTRSTVTTASAAHDSAPIAEIVAEFCDANDLKPPREDIYPNNLMHPNAD